MFPLYNSHFQKIHLSHLPKEFASAILLGNRSYSFALKCHHRSSSCIIVVIRYRYNHNHMHLSTCMTTMTMHRTIMVMINIIIIINLFY